MEKYNLESFAGTKWVFILVKNNKIIYRSKKQGLRPLIFCLKNRPGDLKGALVYDKVIGRAAALLMIYGKVKTVLTPMISKSALEVFNEHEILAEYGKVIEKVMNRTGDDLCSMEKLSADKTVEELARVLIKN